MALATQPSTCNRDHSEDEEQAEALSVTAQVTPTPPWAVVWDTPQPVEDETHYLLSSQESDPLHRHGGQQGVTASVDWLNRDPSAQEVTVGAGGDGGRTEEGETEPEEGGESGVTHTGTHTRTLAPPWRPEEVSSLREEFGRCQIARSGGRRDGLMFWLASAGSADVCSCCYGYNYPQP